MLLLFAAAFLGGALNAVAGGGSFIVLPTLLYAGVAPVAANATTTLSLWPGAVSSAWAYRREIAAGGPRSFLALGIISLAGGLLGAELLLGTSDDLFLHVLPWLMLVAASTFTFGGRLTRRFRSGSANGSSGLRYPWWALLLQLGIATYGGYFGGGIGVMMLAAMAVAGLSNIHQMNGLKTALAATINGIATAEFVRRGTVVWDFGLMMMVGGIAGGYVGASLARRLDGRLVRAFVVTVAWSMTLYFFLATR